MNFFGTILSVVCVTLLAATVHVMSEDSCLIGKENNYQQDWVSSAEDKWCCNTCNTGAYMTRACEVGKPDTTQCSVCPDGTFTDIPNLRDDCMPHTQCLLTKHRIPKTHGSKTTDFTCQCEPGYYELQSEDCKVWTVCPVGSGVLQQGSPTDDVECQECLNGTFSDVNSSTSTCSPHTNCQAEGLEIVTNGTSSNDTVCSTAPSVSPGNYTSTVVPPASNTEMYIGIGFGVAIGIVVVLVIIFLVIRCYCRRRRLLCWRPNVQDNQHGGPPQNAVQRYAHVLSEDMDTDSLPAGAAASNYQPTMNGSANGSVAHTSATGNSVNDTKLQVPVGMSESDYRGNRHPSSQCSASNGPQTPGSAVLQPGGESSVYGLSEAGSHPSRTTQNDLGRIVRNGDDGMQTSGSEYPMKERQVRRQAQQDH